MLAEVKTPHADFAALCSYLLRGKPGAKHNPARVAWTMTHNLHTDIPEHAAKVMDATALLSPRVQKPTYHTMIAWHVDETPTPEEMQHIALRTLQMMGLEEHQALIVGHGDTPHRHLHMAINRVHPASGRAWKTSHDYIRLDRVMKALAEEHGFAYVPSHRFNIGDTAVKERTRGLTKATYNLAKRDGKKLLPQWTKAQSEAFGHRHQAAIDAATSWDQLAGVFAAEGLKLQAKGQGLILMGEESYSKLSALGAFARAKAFAARFGESFEQYQARIADLDALEPDMGQLAQPAHQRPRRAPQKVGTNKTILQTPVQDNAAPRRLNPALLNTLAVESTLHFQSAHSWADLSLRLKPLGIALAPKGRGLIFKRGQHVLPFRKLAPDHTIKELQTRFGESFYRHRQRLEDMAHPKALRPATRHHTTGLPLKPPPRREPHAHLDKPRPKIGHAQSPEDSRSQSRIFSVDGIDITRTLASLGLASRQDVNNAVQEALQKRQAASDRAKLPSIAETIAATLKPFLEAADKKSQPEPQPPPEPPKPPEPESEEPEEPDDDLEPEPRL